MPSTGYIDGSLLRLTLSDTEGSEVEIFHATESSISFSLDVTDITTKDSGSGGWRDIFPKTKSATISFSGLVRYDETASEDNMSGLLGYFNGRTDIYWVMATSTSGDVQLSGQGYITALNQTATADTEVSFDGTIEVSGAVTIGTVS
jgi:predicted secreted protein